jgi:hypothetical protein
VLTDRVLPPVSRYVPHQGVEQLVVSPHDDLAGVVARLHAAGDEFDAIYDLTLLDPCNHDFRNAVTALSGLCGLGAKVHLILAGGVEESRLISVGRHLSKVGFVAVPGWTALLGGAAGSNFADPNVEPYLCADVDGAARPVAAVEFTRVGSSVADAPALAKLAV